MLSKTDIQQNLLKLNVDLYKYGWRSAQWYSIKKEIKSACNSLGKCYWQTSNNFYICNGKKMYSIHKNPFSLINTSRLQNDVLNICTYNISLGKKIIDLINLNKTKLAEKKILNEKIAKRFLDSMRHSLICDCDDVYVDSTSRLYFKIKKLEIEVVK